MSTVRVNGKDVKVPDGSVVNVVNDKLYINGLEWKGGEDDDGSLTGVVRLELSGDIKEVKTDASLHVHGDVQGSASAGGSIKCGNITGHVKAGGSVNCQNVSGNVTAAGSVMKL